VWLAFLLFVPFLTAQVNFNPIDISSGDTSSAGVATGDFDNDGIVDLVTTNTSTLSFYKGLGHGNFASPVNQSTPQSFRQAMAADFNRDGKLDLAVVTSHGNNVEVTILLGNGDGTFGQGTVIDLPGDQQFIALADFNGDHLPDIAVSYSGNGSGTRVYLGHDDGTFKLASSLNFGGWQIVVGDCNADGHQDIAVSNLSTVALYLGNGNGDFQGPLPTVAGKSNLNAGSIAVGDFYNNRTQTLVALGGDYSGQGNFDDYIYTLRYKNGYLLAENYHLLDAATGNPYQQIVGGDLNGDFKDDLFFVGGNFQASATSAYMVGNGNGTFQNQVPAPYDGDLQTGLLIRDLDGDSRHDIGIAFTFINDFGGLEALLNTSAETNCPVPPANALAVNICAPYEGQIVGQTFTFIGSGNAFNGIAKRMELWIDGKKVSQNLEDQLNATLSLSKGSHTASFVVVDSFDQYIARSVTFTSSY
jgi:hypothetical protein